MKKPKVIYSAIYRNGVVIAANDHDECIKLAVEKHGWKLPIKKKEKGFIDEYGYFHSEKDFELHKH